MRKKLFAWVMTFAMLLSLLPATGLTALAAEGDVTYRVPTYVNNDPAKGISGWETESTNQYTTITNQTTWNAGWYVVNSNVTITGGVTVNGDVNLILTDGSSLTISNDTENCAGITVTGSTDSLTIFGQSGETGTLAVRGGKKAAGIGGGYDSDNREGYPSSKITINGGNVTAVGGQNGTGIGGGLQCSGGSSNSNITINGGTVTAATDESKNTYGIYSFGENGSSIIINGGDVKATGTAGDCCGICSESTDGDSSITINGGDVVTKCNNVGGGIFSRSENADSKLTINGGTVTATNTGAEDDGTFSGISIQSEYASSSITITGGDVTAQSTAVGEYECNFSGIDIRSSTSFPSSIAIKGGKVTATSAGTGKGEDYGSYGISFIDGNNNSFAIDGGTVEAIGTDRAFKIDPTLKSGLSAKAGASKENANNITGNDLNKLATNGYKYVNVFLDHTHAWSYALSKTTADNDTITAKCTENCPYAGTDKSLTIAAPASLIYDGSEKTATFGMATTFLGGDLPAITYEYKATVDGTYATATNIKDAGCYKASFTVGSGEGAKTAYVEYTITKADQTKTASEPTLVSKTETVITINAVTVECETVEYAKNTTNSAPESGWQTGTEFTGLRANTTYYIFARVKESTNYKAGPASEALEAKTNASSGGGSGGGGSSSTHQVSVTTPTNGTIKLDKTYATKGSTVTITVTPNEGYTVDAVSVKDASGNTIETTKTSDTTYTFTMPNSKVTVSATFKSEKEETTTPMTQPTTLPFTDVKSGDWFHDSVAYVYEKTLMNGVSDTKFAPNDTTTRAMVVTILWRMAGSPVVNYAMPFTDVPEDQWYTEAVRWAASTGVVKGISDTEFGPNVPVTREALATMIYRIQQEQGNGFVGTWVFLLPQSDANQVSEWADEAMHWCVMKGVINGDDQNNLNPQENATRAEIATIFKNLDTVEQ